MTSRGIRVAMTVLVVLFAGSYSIYTAVRYFYSPYRTETAYEYTLADSYRDKAVAVRDEQVIEASVAGVLSYVRGDSDVVIPGSLIAEVYSDQNDLRWRNLASQYEGEIKLLEDAQVSSEGNWGADALNAQINDATGALITSAAQGDLTELSQQRDRLQLLLGRKQIVTGRESGYAERVSYLKEQQQYALSQISGRNDRITAPIGGYFCSTVDGYEGILSMHRPLSALEYRRVIHGQTDPEPATGVGRVHLDHNWNLVMVVPRTEVARFVEGASVTLDFGLSDCREIPAVVESVTEPDESGLSVVTIACNRLNDKLIALRHVTVSVRFKSYSGLKVSAGALRFDGRSEGVYVLQGGRVVFKKIEKVFENETFVLCRYSEQDNPDWLRLFDEVIVEGVDLYDGKIVK